MSKKSKFVWFPTPYHSLLLWLVWQILHEFSRGHMVLGAVFAIVIPWIVAPLSEKEPVAKNPLKVLLYLLRLVQDIIVSNFEVAKRVLQSNRHLKPAFIAVPITISEPLPLTIFTSSVSLTPGTCSVELSDDKQWLYVHVLHLEDEQKLIAQIKQRYEAPIKEIFQC
ncbi:MULTISPECIES: Na+/H+ antiporter subunit E [unclassified Agarivorans]|uniref:Na+/H+ antiporter subunit E n=1 Tax=unclassified Agarivorans TaxID=2636026 RepID=UPI0010ED9F37|nr:MULTISPECIES: Na+/H+ antiporter subunit E [unclassified Agarivorans]MDO6687102.1 Na+/H+ antiporter subunit E [Agarivorans sp. 3_MG-2023]MDO6713486.1 Na+/H+ antiporter subunit E [Agarivorans sp. 2_MG-2023]GDY28022.1 monovalent cation/H+ antiporter subunit E [Agarivorans sp. Toyoura001]